MSNYRARHPAAFINMIAEEGTKAEAIEWLQRTWDDYTDAKADNLALRLENDALQLEVDGNPVPGFELWRQANCHALRVLYMRDHDDLRDEAYLTWLFEQFLMRDADSASEGRT